VPFGLRAVQSRALSMLSFGVWRCHTFEVSTNRGLCEVLNELGLRASFTGTGDHPVRPLVRGLAVAAAGLD
jgi:hypothetical protein